MLVRTLLFLLVPLAMGAGSVYLMLPKPRRRLPLVGAALGAMALLLAAGFSLRGGVVTVEAFLFYAFAGSAIVAGGLLITQTNPARAALAFALVVLSTCGLFLLQAAPFLMAATIIIYAGAIIVTFLFVLMLAQQTGVSDADQRTREPEFATLTGFGLLGALLCLISLTYANEASYSGLAPLLKVVRTAAGKDTGDELIAALGSEQERLKLFTAFHELPPYDRRREDELIEIEQRWLDARDKYQEAARHKAAAEKQLTAPNLTAEDRADATRIASEAQVDMAVGLAGMKAELHQLAGMGQRQGLLQPDQHLRLSAGSGPPANGPVPRDAMGRPAMPADNPAHLGRALFTDYLIPFQLGGTLLLVATIGAIVIAGRRSGERAA